MIRALSNSDTAVVFEDLLNKNDGVFIGRLGGSDTNVVYNYYKDTILQKKQIDMKKYKNLINILEEFNGYYDIIDDINNFHKFMKTMIECYKACDTLMVGVCIPPVNKYYLNKYGPEDELYDKFMLYLQNMDNLYIHSYSYIESMKPFLNFMCNTFGGKKILIISPFEQTINKQRAVLKNLLKNGTYPDFELLTYNTPITYKYKDYTQYPHKNWFETADHIATEINNIDFDIALMSCGSYAMYLGKTIKNSGRKAIYVGGVLQLFFGIMGRRYDSEGMRVFLSSMFNLEHFVYPIETPKYIKDADKSGQKTEGFFAYF